MFRQLRLLSLVLALSAPLVLAAEPASKVTLDTSETLFTLMTAANACGLDQDLSRSEPLRARVRAEVELAVRQSPDARMALERVCAFYRDHRLPDAARNVAQYVSLALFSTPPPQFRPTINEADLPPDAAYVLGILSPLEQFYRQLGIHQIWESHHADYDALTARFAPELKKVLLDTDVYLRLPISGYSGRQLIVLMEPMAPPSQVNSRNYASRYYLVMSPEQGALRVDAIRHAYLHFTLDPMFGERGNAMARLEPLLLQVAKAPLEDSFKHDITLLSAESLIRAIEARTSVTGRTRADDELRAAAAARAAQEGLILAPYFEQALAGFEKDEEGFSPAFANWLFNIDIAREVRRASTTVFLRAAPAGAHTGGVPARRNSLVEAESRLAAGDLAAARDLAQQALTEPGADRGRALFVLARAAAESRDMTGAQAYFERAIAAGGDRSRLGWSHLFLARILDFKGERPAAVEHYRSALASAEGVPALRAAAEQGLARAYQPPSRKQAAEDDEEDDKDTPDKK